MMLSRLKATAAFFLFLALITYAACKSRAGSQTKAAPSSSDASITHINQLIDLAQKHRTIEKTIEHLPLSLRNSFTLIHTPQGSQQGDKTNPRALLFSSVDNVMLTFNSGDKQFAGHQDIEVAFYNEDKATGDAQLELYGLTFDPAGKQEVQVSGPNPGECTTCHGQGSKTHYIWGDYPNWPTVYGNNNLEHRDSPPAEMLKALRKHPRYGKLEFVDNNAPYNCEKPGCSPNSRLTPLIGRQQARLLVSELRRNPDAYRAMQGPLLRSLYACKDGGTKLPFSDHALTLSSEAGEPIHPMYGSAWWSGFGTLYDSMRAIMMEDYMKATGKKLKYPVFSIKPTFSSYTYYFESDFERYDQLAKVAMGPESILSWEAILTYQLKITETLKEDTLNMLKTANKQFEELCKIL